MVNINNEIANILIVDDDPAAIFLSEKLLQNKFNTVGVLNGHDAINAVKINNYDVVLMDINLGNESMDGLRTMRIIKQISKNKHLKIIALTSYTNIVEFYITLGFDDLYLKPINEEIFEKINNLLPNLKKNLNYYL